ncbi:MAG: hypothetical protein WCC18_14620 [Candidatus Acidiferrales bacterium]
MSDIKFEEPSLSNLLVHPSRVPAGGSFAIFDPALSDEKTSDFSSLGFFKVAPDPNVKVATGATPPPCLWVLEVFLERWDELEMPYQIAKYLHQHQPTALYAEKAGFWKTFQAAVQVEVKKNNDSSRLHFFRASNCKGAKVERISEFHRMIEADRVRFVAGDYINALFEQAESFTTLKPWKKDDGLDVCGMAAFHFQGRLLV